ncbi:MAG TPA: hypothetical protein VFH38_10730 [Jatrophihabitans sp.]|nr:hypothetical protein [Jatrophihabitans sp.]
MTEPLTAIRDPRTLRERYADPQAARDRAEALRREIREAPDEVAELIARAELVDVLRVLGDLDNALHEARAAADRAEIAGTGPQQHTARVRLAHVHQWRGEFAESNVEYTELLAAAGQFGPVIEAFTHQHAGENDFEQGHWADAVAHFERALRLRADLELPDEELEPSRVCLSAARQRLQDGPADEGKRE